MKCVFEEFDCANCDEHIKPLNSGTRNHCTNCLCSKHVDGEKPGDRAEHCHGLMEPIAAEIRKGRYFVLQQCQCGHTRWNRCEPDDNFDAIVQASTSGGVTVQALSS